jgi:DNA-binding response OmpR family regulator
VSPPCLILVEPDILIRHPLAEYLRECGYHVLEASTASEARQLLADDATRVDAVLADVDSKDGSGFALASWVRTNHPSVEVILAGTVAHAAEKAGELCNDGPALTKPYDHKFVLDYIRQRLAARDRNQ